MKQDSKFEKRDCKECGKKTWHFRSWAPPYEFKCPCQEEKQLEKAKANPHTIPAYSPKNDVKVVVPGRRVREIEPHTHLKSRWIPREGPPVNLLERCIACGERLVAWRCKPGSILGNMQFFTWRGQEIVPMYGVAMGRSVLIKMDHIEIVKRIGFHKRHKGRICDKCVGISKKVADAKGEEHPLIIVDGDPPKRPETKFYRHETSVDDPLPPLGGEVVDVRAYRAFRKI